MVGMRDGVEHVLKHEEDVEDDDDEMLIGPVLAPSSLAVTRMLGLMSPGDTKPVSNHLSTLKYSWLCLQVKTAEKSSFPPQLH